MSIYDYYPSGAAGDGVQDDTDYIQKAIDRCQQLGGGVVNLPRGVYKISKLVIGNDIILLGAGAGISILKTTLADGDVVTVLGAGVRLCDLEFDSFVPRTGGSYVNFTATSERGDLSHFLMEKAYIGVTLSGPDTLYVQQGIIRNLSTSPGSCGVLINGGQDQYIRYLTMNNEPNRQPSDGIRIYQTGNCNISDCDLMHCGFGLHITGGFSIYVRDCFFDSSVMGILIDALTPIQRCHFMGCWTSGHTQHGVFLDPSSPASIDSIDFIGHNSLSNINDGIYLGKGSNFRVQSCTCAANKGSGVGVGHLASHVQILGNKLGGTELVGNAYGVFLVNGCDYVTISNNDLLGNTTANLAGVAAHQIANNNFI